MENYHDITNEMLMDQVKNSDRKTFAMLYDRLWSQMYFKAYAILKDESQAKDVVQEVWISFWERREKIENQNIEGFLLNSVRFKVFNTLRDSKNKRPLIEEFVEFYKSKNRTNNVEEYSNLSDTRKIIHNSVEELPKKCREVFVLSRFQGLKNNEIAQKMGISQRTVETHISNALKALKKNVALSLVLLFLFL